MAGTHATIGEVTGKFARIFRVLHLIREGGASATIDGMDQLRTEIETVFDADDAHRKIMPFVQAVVDGMKVACDNAIVALRSAFDRYALDILRNDIGSTATATDDIVRDLRENFLIDSQDVLENVITTSAITADATNTGTAIFAVYDEEVTEKRDNERIQTENFVIQCTGDVRQNGRTSGNELFSIQGDHHGVGPNAALAGNEATTQNRLDNGNFEDTSGTFPNSWTITTDNTTGGLSSEATLFHRGASALKAVADGSATAFDIEQAETAFVNYSTAKLQPLGVYMISCAARYATGQSGTLTIQFAGTGYTPGSTEKISQAVSGLTTSYQILTAFVVMPKSIPSDMNLEVTWTGTPTATHILYLDDITVQEATEWEDAGIYYAGVPGDVDSIAGPAQADYYTFNTARQAVGTSLFQDFFTLVTNRNLNNPSVYPDIGVALPSKSSDGSANYAEADAG
jgi:hypothetical protein